MAVNNSPTGTISWEVTSSEVAHPLIEFDAMGGVAKWNDTLFVIGGNGTLWNGDYAKWELWKGTSMDNLQKEVGPTFKEPFPYYRTKGNEWHYYWAMGLWIDPDNGDFYTIAYSEYDFMNGWVTEAKERRLGLAKSIDQGKTWAYEGDIITQGKSIPAPIGKEYNGAGDISFFIANDGYAYIYYKVGFYDYVSFQRTDQDICVARSPISEKLAPGSWKKFYDGAWEEPGLGGIDEILFPSTSIVTVSFNSYLDKFVLIGNSLTGNAFISFADDMNNQTWTEKDFSFPDITSWYLWQVNPITNDQFTMGETFRLYTTGVENDERVGYYHNVKFKYQDYSTDGWQIVDYSSCDTTYGAEGDVGSLLDENPNTFWVSEWNGSVALPPHHITVDMGEVNPIHGISFMSRIDYPWVSGHPKTIQVLVSMDNNSWTDAGTIGNIPLPPKETPGVWNRFFVPNTVEGRYVKVVIHEMNDSVDLATFAVLHFF